MARIKENFSNYWVPIVALLVIIAHFLLANTFNLSKWKGGGFGMYTEVHYYYNEVFIPHLDPPLTVLADEHYEIEKIMKDIKRMPNDGNLEKMAKSISKFVSSDTITIQVWKPFIDSESANYSRELVNELQYLK